MVGLGWGIAGCGWVARDYGGPAIQASRNGHVAALFDPASASLQQAARLFDAPAYTNIDAFLATPGLGAVYIAAPNHAHRALVEAAGDAAAARGISCAASGPPDRSRSSFWTPRTV